MSVLDRIADTIDRLGRPLEAVQIHEHMYGQIPFGDLCTEIRDAVATGTLIRHHEFGTATYSVADQTG